MVERPVVEDRRIIEAELRGEIRAIIVVRTAAFGDRDSWRIAVGALRPMLEDYESRLGAEACSAKAAEEEAKERVWWRRMWSWRPPPSFWTPVDLY